MIIIFVSIFLCDKYLTKYEGKIFSYYSGSVMSVERLTVQKQTSPYDNK